VKTLRIWLVLLLVLLLPVRGAVAAGMLCEIEHQLSGSLASAHAVVADKGHAHEHGAHHGQAAHADSTPGETANASTDSDACGLCSGCCSAIGMVSSLPVLAAPHALNSVPFPSVAAAAPSFIPRGLERPPRSI
jgi:hypothetical protein